MICFLLFPFTFLADLAEKLGEERGRTHNE